MPTLALCFLLYPGPVEGYIGSAVTDGAEGWGRDEGGEAGG